MLDYLSMHIVLRACLSRRISYMSIYVYMHTYSSGKNFPLSQFLWLVYQNVSVKKKSIFFFKNWKYAIDIWPHNHFESIFKTLDAKVKNSKFRCAKISGQASIVSFCYWWSVFFFFIGHVCQLINVNSIVGIPKSKLLQL